MRVRRHVRNVVVGSVLAYGPMVLIHGACIAGYGPWVIAGVEAFLLVPLLALLIGLLTLPFALRDRTRQDAVAVVVVAAGLFLAMVPALLVSMKLRMVGFRLAAKRAEPLVQAVERHVKDHGVPPDKLSDLVPRYLPGLPFGTPELEIITGDRARKGFHGNEWALSAVVSTGFINWDQFIYLPNQQYPERGHGGWLERVDRWAYVHE